MTWGRTERFPSSLESNAAGFGRRWLHQLTDGVEEGLNVSVVAYHFPLQLAQLGCQLFMRDDSVPQPHKGTDHEDAHVDCVRAVQHVGCHDGPMLSKDVGQVLDILAPLQDHSL